LKEYIEAREEIEKAKKEKEDKESKEIKEIRKSLRELKKDIFYKKLMALLNRRDNLSKLSSKELGEWIDKNLPGTQRYSMEEIIELDKKINELSDKDLKELWNKYKEYLLKSHRLQLLIDKPEKEKALKEANLNNLIRYLCEEDKQAAFLDWWIDYLKVKTEILKIEVELGEEEKSKELERLESKLEKYQKEKEILITERAIKKLKEELDEARKTGNSARIVLVKIELALMKDKLERLKGNKGLDEEDRAMIRDIKEIVKRDQKAIRYGGMQEVMEDIVDKSGLKIILRKLNCQIGGEPVDAVTLVAAIIKAESDWDYEAVSGKGARGLMQLMKSGWSHAMELLNENWSFEDAFEPEKNILAGIRYFIWCLETAKKLSLIHI